MIYHYLAHRQTICMVLAYSKNVKDNLTEAQRAELKELASVIKKGRN